MTSPDPWAEYRALHRSPDRRPLYQRPEHQEADSLLDQVVAIGVTARRAGRDLLASEKREALKLVKRVHQLRVAAARRYGTQPPPFGELGTEVRERIDAVCSQEEEALMPEKKTLSYSEVVANLRGNTNLSDAQLREVADEIYRQAGGPGGEPPVDRGTGSGEPDRKMRFGSTRYATDGRGVDYRKAETLAADLSVREWINARDGSAREFTDFDGAWNALAAGIVHDDWTEWRNEYTRRVRLDMSGGGEGGELIPSPLSGDVIDLMRSSTPIFQAGATTVPMSARTLDIARITADPAASTWHAEAGTITPDTAMTLDRVTFTAKTLPVIVKASMELSEDAPNLGQVVRRALAGAIGVELTKKALHGDGTSNAPTGIRNQTGVEAFAIGANGGALTIDMLIDRVTTIQTANAAPNAILWHPRTAGGVTKLAKDSNGNYFELPSPLRELGKFSTSAVRNTLSKGSGTNLAEVFFGQWPQLLIGMRTNLQIRVLDQRYADAGQVAFMAWLRADVQLAHGAAFSVITDTST